MTLSENERKKDRVDSFLKDFGDLDNEDQRTVLGLKKRLGLYPKGEPEWQETLDTLYNIALAKEAHRRASRPKVSRGWTESRIVPGGTEFEDEFGNVTFTPHRPGEDMATPEGRAAYRARREAEKVSELPDGTRSERVESILQAVEARQGIDLHEVFALQGDELRVLWPRLDERTKQAVLQAASKLVPVGKAVTKRG